MSNELQNFLQQHAPTAPDAPAELEAQIWQKLQTIEEPTTPWQQLLIGMLPLAAAILLTVSLWTESGSINNQPIEPFVYELGVDVMEGGLLTDDSLDYATEIIEWTGI